MNEKVNLLPHWCITDLQPAIYDVESSTAIEQTGKLYAKIQELIKIYNEFVDAINLKIKDQDAVIADTVDYLKTNLGESINELIAQGDIYVGTLYDAENEALNIVTSRGV